MNIQFIYLWAQTVVKYNLNSLIERLQKLDFGLKIKIGKLTR